MMSRYSGFPKSSTLLFKHSLKSHCDFFANLNQQRKDGTYCDVKIVAHGQEFNAHKVVLVSRSSYFETMLNSGLKESLTNVIDLSATFMNADVVSNLINYFYGCEVLINNSIIEDLVHAANLLLLEDLRDACGQFLLTNLGVHNCCETWLLADLLSLEKLSILSKQFVMAHFHNNVICNSSSLQLPGDYLTRLVHDGVFSFMQPSEWLRYLVKWINEDVDNRLDFVFHEKNLKSLKIDDLKLIYFPDSEKKTLESLSHAAESMRKSEMMALQSFPEDSECIIFARNSRQRSNIDEDDLVQNEKDFILEVFFPGINQWLTYRSVVREGPFPFNEKLHILGFISEKLFFVSECSQGRPLEICALNLKTQKTESVKKLPANLFAKPLIFNGQFYAFGFEKIGNQSKYKFLKLVNWEKSLSNSSWICLRSKMLSISISDSDVLNDKFGICAFKNKLYIKIGLLANEEFIKYDGDSQAFTSLALPLNKDEFVPIFRDGEMFCKDPFIMFIEDIDIPGKDVPSGVKSSCSFDTRSEEYVGSEIHFAAEYSSNELGDISKFLARQKNFELQDQNHNNDRRDIKIYLGNGMFYHFLYICELIRVFEVEDIDARKRTRINLPFYINEDSETSDFEYFGYCLSTLPQKVISEFIKESQQIAPRVQGDISAFDMETGPYYDMCIEGAEMAFTKL